ncbi:ABC transporter permease [Terrarubrum flagellatum]|uniref:ABC transporter permease n=1 Tax=Terrirubrum flagellatum TaxID=2895980 RepID=UPI0031455006
MSAVALGAAAPPAGRRRSGGGLVYIVAIGLPAAFFVAFFLGPLLYLVLLGFWRVENFSIVTSFSFGNYRDIAANFWRGSSYGLAIAQTLYVAATTAILAVALTYPMALAIVFSVPERWQRLVILLSVAPFWTSYILRVYAWQVLLARRGVVNGALAYIGLGDWQVNILYTQIATRIGLLHFLAPILVIILYVSIRNVDPTLIEASRQIGATRIQTLGRVILPMTRTGVILSLSFAALVACGDVLSGSILGGGAGDSALGKAPLFANMIVRAYASSTNLPHTAALAIVLILVMIALLLIGFAASERTKIVTK